MKPMASTLHTASIVNTAVNQSSARARNALVAERSGSGCRSAGFTLCRE